MQYGGRDMLNDILYGVLDILYDESDGDYFQCCFSFFSSCGWIFFPTPLVSCKVSYLATASCKEKWDARSLQSMSPYCPYATCNPPKNTSRRQKVPPKNTSHGSEGLFCFEKTCPSAVICSAIFSSRLFCHVPR